jgi:hypothetical protein
MRLRAGAVLVAAAAIVAAGCGGGSGGGSSTSSSDTGQTSDARALLTAAPAKVANANSSKVSFSISIDSDQLPSALTIPGQGQFDYKAKEGRLTMDYGDVLSAAGQSGNGKMEIRSKGNVYYLKWPLLSKTVGASTPWISFDVTKLNQISGIDTSSLQQVNQGDPSQTLVYLKAAGTVDEQGTEDVGGVSTTKYHAIIDVDKIPGLAPADKRAAVAASVKSLKEQYGISKLPMDVWLDGQGLPRKLFYDISTKAQGQKVKTSLTMNLSDYGVKVNVAPPPASQVTDLADIG